MVKWIVLWSWSDVWFESLKLITIYFTKCFTNYITNTFRNCITCFHNLLSRKIPKRDKESRRVTKGACRVQVGWRRGPKGAKSVLGKGIFDRYTPKDDCWTQWHGLQGPKDPKTTVAQCARLQRRLLHSLRAPKDDSCTVYKAPKTTVAQFTRPQRRQLHSLKAPKRGSDDSCTVSRVDKGQLEQLERAGSIPPKTPAQIFI